MIIIKKSYKRLVFARSKSKTVIAEIMSAVSIGETIDSTEGISKKINSSIIKKGFMPASK